RSHYLRWSLGPMLLAILVSCQAAPPATSPDTSVAPEATPSNVPPPDNLPPPGKLPPPPPANSYLAQLPPDAANQLVALDINIAIPTYLPPNMTLANYDVGTTEAGTPYYWLVYRNDQNRCFAIEYAASSIENMSLENQETLALTTFGDDYHLYHGKFPNGGAGELPTSDLFTEWLEGEDGFYRLVGAGLVNAQNYGQKDCVNIAVKEAIAVAESLSYLPTDIRTLDVFPPEPEPSQKRS
ncbi:MAG: hypothetical protein AAGA83_10585, partial [Cyanobacteria bacterium P01_F01_bin.116]